MLFKRFLFQNNSDVIADKFRCTTLHCTALHCTALHCTALAFLSAIAKACLLRTSCYAGPRTVRGSSQIKSKVLGIECQSDDVTKKLILHLRILNTMYPRGMMKNTHSPNLVESVNGGPRYGRMNTYRNWPH